VTAIHSIDDGESIPDFLFFVKPLFLEHNVSCIPLILKDFAETIDVIRHGVAHDISDKEQVWRFLRHQPHGDTHHNAVKDIYPQSFSIASVIGNVTSQESFCAHVKNMSIMVIL